MSDVPRFVQWPDECPDVPELDAGKMHTWHHLFGETTEAFGRLLGPETRCYLELGTWCGGSAQLAARLAPNARVVCVDAWDGRGSTIYGVIGGEKALRLCVANLWWYRDRVSLVRADTQDGLRFLHAAGLRPDIIYIDADHHYEPAGHDIRLSRELFPDAILCGDDYDEECGRAVDAILGADCIESIGKFWRYLSRP